MLHISTSAIRAGRERRNLGDSGNLKMKGNKKLQEQSCKED